MAETVTCFEPLVLDVSAVVALERAIAAVGTPLDGLMRRAVPFPLLDGHVEHLDVAALTVEV